MRREKERQNFLSSFSTVENCEEENKTSHLGQSLSVKDFKQLLRYAVDAMESESCIFDSDTNEENTVFEEFGPM